MEFFAKKIHHREQKRPPKEYRLESSEGMSRRTPLEVLEHDILHILIRKFGFSCDPLSLEEEVLTLVLGLMYSASWRKSLSKYETKDPNRMRSLEDFKVFVRNYSYKFTKDRLACEKLVVLYDHAIEFFSTLERLEFPVRQMVEFSQTAGQDFIKSEIIVGLVIKKFPTKLDLDFSKIYENQFLQNHFNLIESLILDSKKARARASKLK